jgi:uncharacterized protein (TIGR02271 family)
MAMKKRTTVVGVFSDYPSADRAVTELRKAGFREDQIGFVGRHESAEVSAVDRTANEGETYAEEGALTGVLAGAGLGALAGLGILAGVIPVIGPAIAAGTLGVILTNVAGGAAVAGLAGALIGAGIPEEEAEYYNKEFEAGRAIVSVTADGRADEATAILRRHGAYDMHTAGETCTTATTGSTATAARTTRTAAATTVHRGEGEQRMQVREEELRATKRPVETGEVTVRKEVHTEHKTMEVPVRREEVVIERHAATGQTASSCDIREGEEIRVPVMEEQVTVQKTPVVKEEVTVGKRVVHDTERVSGDVRKEEIRVERTGDAEIRKGGKHTPKP